MKKTITILIFVIALIVIYLYFFQHKKETQAVTNGAFQETLGETINDNPKPLLKTKKATTPLEIQANEPVTQLEEEKELTFLSAYREYKYYQSCLFLFSSQLKPGTPLENFIAEKKASSTTGNEPTTEQLEQFNYFNNKCNSMLESETEQPYLALLRIQKRYKEITPITDEELTLAKALEIEERINISKSEITAEKTGTRHLTIEELKAKAQKQLDVSERMMALQLQISSAEKPTNEELQQMQEIFKEFQEMNKPAEGSVNEEEIALLQNDLITDYNELAKLFKNHQTPDVFLIFSKNFLNDSGIKERSFIEDDLNSKLGLYDDRYIASLNEIITPFIACSLNYPCDSKSHLALQYCINQYVSHPKACNMSLDEYLLDVMLSPNQLIDINNYFSYLMENYAQN